MNAYCMGSDFVIICSITHQQVLVFCLLTIIFIKFWSERKCQLKMQTSMQFSLQILCSAKIIDLNAKPCCNCMINQCVFVHDSPSRASSRSERETQGKELNPSEVDTP